jgi:hypothetical protein
VLREAKAITGRANMYRFIAVAVFCTFTFSTLAVADEATSPSGQVQALDVVHLPNKRSASKRKARSTKVRVTLSLRRTDGTKPSPTTGVKVHLPRGMILNYNKFRKCSLSRLQSQGPRGCPRGSRIGTGSLKADATPVVSEPVGGTVTAFNGAGRTLQLYVVPELSSPLTIVGKLSRAPEGPYENLLDFNVPLVPTLPGQPNATLTYFQVTIGGTTKKRQRVRGRRRTVKIPYIANSTRCVDRTYPWRFDFTYENGEQLRPVDAAPCA